MGSKKTTQCKSCGHEISSVGKVTCPSCGRVNKKPVYKRVWFIVLVAFIVIGVIGSIGGNSSDDRTQTSNTLESTSTEVETEEVKVDPIVVTVDTLIDELNSNALKASKTYKGQYVKLTGKLSTIDSSGDYFSLGILSDKFSFDTVLCRIEDEHIDKVMEFTDGQEVTVIGTITDVGEVMGYSLEVEQIQ